MQKGDKCGPLLPIGSGIEEYGSTHLPVSPIRSRPYAFRQSRGMPSCLLSSLQKWKSSEARFAVAVAAGRHGNYWAYDTEPSPQPIDRHSLFSVRLEAAVKRHCSAPAFSASEVITAMTLWLWIWVFIVFTSESLYFGSNGLSVSAALLIFCCKGLY